MQVRMCASAGTMTSFCLEAGKGQQEVCNRTPGALEHSRMVPTMTEEGPVGVAPPALVWELLTSCIVLAVPGRQLSVNRGCLSDLVR